MMQAHPRAVASARVRRRGRAAPSRRSSPRVAAPQRSATARTQRRTVPARQQGRADQARDLPAVRQHALPARQRQRPVRPRADAAPAELPQGQRHARHQRPHDPHLAHRGRDPLVADRPLPGPQRARRSRTRTTTSRDRRAALHDSFKYWTDTVDGTNDTLPNMVGDGGQTTPAPWLTYTRAGCNVGGVSAANIELENNSINPVATSRPSSGRFAGGRGAARPSAWPTSSASRSTARKGNALCDDAEREARPGDDRSRLRRGLQGALRRQVRQPGDHHGNGCVKATDGTNITDPTGTTAASRASTGRSRRTRSARSRRCRRTACPSRSRTSRTRTTTTRSPAPPAPAKPTTSSSSSDYDDAFARSSTV